MKHILVLAILLMIVWGFCYAQKGSQRISFALQDSMSKKKAGEFIDVMVAVKDLPGLLKTDSIQLLKQYAPAKTALIRLTVSKLNVLLNSDNIIFADQYRTPKEELTTGTLDIGLNKISLVHNKYPLINGDSVFASIKEQRFDTTDIDIKGRYFDSKLASSIPSSHASIMATMLAGGGNTSPFAKGAAWGSYVTSSDFASLLPDADSVYQKFKISVQNHSYGTRIENYYGADAAAFDLSTKNNPSLLHVFSAGNSGNSSSGSGTYAGIQDFASITGSFKMAKNIITVGATDSFNHVVAPSSKGPAYDGRVKPELVAFGEDGSSGAAALVSGSVALLQHAYKRFHSNAFPSNALVKAVLLNSADDVERPHVDYSSGYGALNTYEAVNTIVENRFLEDRVSQNEVKSFAVTMPANVALAKFTLVWMDVPAEANTPKALVNDLDAELQLPSTGERWLPWVLSSAPHRDSLFADAKRNTDTLNTVEQITVDHPQAGHYVFQVKGSNIQQGANQSFAVAYQIDTVNHFIWTYPSSTDALSSSAKHVIRWQTTIHDTATIEYSLNGERWQTIAHGVDLQDQYFQWIAPDTSSVAFLRMKVPGITSPFVSDSFTVSGIINLHVGFNCADSFLLYWNKIPAARYQLYQLGQKYLQPAASTADTSIVLLKKQFSSFDYAVAPLLSFKAGLRSFTTDYTTQAAGCYINSFLAELQNNAAILTVQLGTLYNIASVSVIKTNSSGAKIVQTLTPATFSFTLSDPGLVRGVNSYQLAIKLISGDTVYSGSEAVFYLPDLPVIIYPNPARQNEAIKIITQTPDEYFITVYDLNGRILLHRTLDDIYQQLPALRFSKGVYLVKVVSHGGEAFVQKLIIY